MKIASKNGYDLVIQTRDHCDPHVHVKSPKWDVRILFSFWKDDVDYWDTRPGQEEPKAPLIESLRQTLMVPASLEKARKAWWDIMGSTCINNKQWSLTQEIVVDSGVPGHQTLRIISSSFDKVNYTTTLRLEDGNEVEIEL